MPGALVRYSRKRAYGALGYSNPYVGYGIKVARFAYANRGRAKMAARVLQRTYRRYRRSGRRGRKTYSSRAAPSKKANSPSYHTPWDTSSVATGGNPINLQTLNLFEVQMPPVATSSASGNPILAVNRITGKGRYKLNSIKICRTIWYNGDYTEAGFDVGRVTVNWALIQLKVSQADLTRGGSTVRQAIEQGFFRDNEGTTERSKDFVAAGPTSDWDHGYTCAPMNPDSSFRIISRQRHELVPFLDSTQAGPARSSVTIHKYIKLRKTVANGSVAVGNQIENPFYELIWYTTTTPRTFPYGSVVTNPHVRTFGTNRIYFREMR